MANQQQVRFREAVGNGVNHIALQAPAIVSADQTITLPDQTGTVITTGDNGSVSSTMLATNLTISAAAGSAAAPSIAFTGDLNTGIYSPGADQLAVATNGTGRLFVDASGSVGIGTSSPGVKLHIADGQIRVANSGAINPSLVFTGNGAGASGFQVGQRYNAQELFIYDLAALADRVVVDSAGRVGIGTASPSQKLHVSGGDTTNVGFNGTTKGVRFDFDGTQASIFGVDNTFFASYQPLRIGGSITQFMYGGTEAARIDSIGNVGIGTSSPTTTLDVNGDVKLASLNGGPLAGFRNRIINGNLDIWQRGTSFSNPADGAYTADRWVIFYDGSGATRTVSQQIFSPGSTEAAPGSLSFLRHAQTVAGSGGTYNVVNQRMEGVRTYEGQTVTLSFYARGTSASLTLAKIQLRQNFGAGGSTEVSTILASNVVIAGSTFARYTYTVTLPSITGKTVGTSAFLELLFNLPVNNTFSLDIASVQLEPGPVATPFEQRPIGAELALCQRYFYKQTFYVPILPWRGTNADFSGHMLPHPVEMRAAPNISGDGAVSPTRSDAVGTLPSGTNTSIAITYITLTFTSFNTRFGLVRNDFSTSTIFSVYGGYIASAEL